jgi:hypothetical protein
MDAEADDRVEHRLGRDEDRDPEDEGRELRLEGRTGRLAEEQGFRPERRPRQQHAEIAAALDDEAVPAKQELRVPQIPVVGEPRIGEVRDVLARERSVHRANEAQAAPPFEGTAGRRSIQGRDGPWVCDEEVEDGVDGRPSGREPDAGIPAVDAVETAASPRMIRPRPA